MGIAIGIYLIAMGAPCLYYASFGGGRDFGRDLLAGFLAVFFCTIGGLILIHSINHTI